MATWLENQRDKARRDKLSRELTHQQSYGQTSPQAQAMVDYARVTQARMNMTPDQRLAQYPYQPEYFEQATGVPLNSLIVRNQ